MPGAALPFPAACVVPPPIPAAAKATKPLLVADLFCGAGGSSTGCRRALAAMGLTMQLVCVNHWPVAIETHKRNHPDARHHCINLDAARPVDLVPEGYLDLLLASPECTHHSRARGGKPMQDQSRMSAWHVLRWAADLWIRCICLENVPEWVEWGPLDKHGRPLKSRKGQTFLAFVGALKMLGYRVEWRVLNAADYGDVTTRNRLYLIARRDGKPLRWPEPTHAREAATDLFGTRKRWRVAREIIAWDRPGQSIFGRRKPLAPRTLDRILAGAVKFGWPAAFHAALRLALVDSLRHHIAAAEAFLAAPLPAGAAAARAKRRRDRERRFLDYARRRLAAVHGALLEAAVPADGPLPDAMLIVLRQHMDARSVDGPVPTVSAGGQHVGVAEPALLPFVLAQAAGGAPRAVVKPLPTIVGGGAISLTEPVLISVTGADRPKPPLSVDHPLGGITTRNGVGVAGGEAVVVTPKGRSDAAPTGAPVPTIATKAQLGVAEPLIAPYYGSGSSTTCKSAEQPIDTITAKARFGVVEGGAAPFVCGNRTHNSGQPVDGPLPGMTTSTGGGLFLAHTAAEPLVVQTDQQGGGVRTTDAPLGTLVTKANPAVIDGLMQAIANDDELLAAARQGRLVIVGRTAYVIDIRFRMLDVDELARAMGFSDEERTYEFVGTKAEQTKQIGNANPVHTAAALVGALLAA